MGDQVTIRLRDSWESYSLIPVRRRVRDFFPGYKERFTLHIGDLSIRTHVTGRTQGQGQAEKGDPTAGTYLKSSVGEIQYEFPEISGGNELTIKRESEDEYRIVDW